MRCVLLLFIIFPLFSFSQDTIRLKADSVKADSSKIVWNCSHPEGVDSFIVQNFKWNRWMTVKTVLPDSSIKCYYSVMSWHSGDNDCRIGFCKKKKIKFTQEVKFFKKYPGWQDEPCLSVTVNDTLHLRKNCKYEIYDKFGNKVKEGTGDRIYVKDLTPDVYYCNCDNKTTEFIRKKSKHK